MCMRWLHLQTAFDFAEGELAPNCYIVYCSSGKLTFPSDFVVILNQFPS